MMNNKNILLTIACILSIVLSSCGSAGGPGPRTWIDTPLDGSTLPLAPVVVRSHASSGSGTASAVLYVNGTQVRVDNVADPSNPLVEISQVWQPDAPGDYVLQVVATDHDGNEGRSNSVRIHVGELESIPPAIPETQVPASTTSTETITPINPIFTFTTNANCRQGPSTQYEVDDSFQEGQSVQVDGRNQDLPRWWWVLRSNGSHCWVSDSTGTASGPTGSVQVVSAPPPPVVIVPTDTYTPPPPPQTAPNAPGNLSVTNHVCASPTYSVTLGWYDQADNEQGYRVYRDNTLITTLGANATSYTDNPPGSGPYTYKVESFNSVGSASATTTDGGCIF